MITTAIQLHPFPRLTAALGFYNNLDYFAECRFVGIVGLLDQRSRKVGLLRQCDACGYPGSGGMWGCTVSRFGTHSGNTQWITLLFFDIYAIVPKHLKLD